MIYVQAKRWEGVVGRPEIQKFAGSLEGQRARKGVFITTSDYTEGAREYVKRIEKKIILINGTSLANYLFKYDIGVSEVKEYIVKKVDLDYFDE
ncbi:restriction endonuclease [Chengkuizengella axinellae]|uniref:restriction endonuclease n=1 Tax=Chengkuizengella axinellae TaxID=3064388 RepID=UPI0035294246